ncbi:MAG: M28 family peptidase [Chloroflexota bacterium]|nr:M28 family peptidase [Chloroflexota bacterium]
MDTTEQTLRDGVSLDNLTRYNAEIAKGVRLSGSADEAEAFAYLAAQCRSYGMEVEQYAIDAYVSLPGAAALTVVSPEQRALTCITHSFSLATGPAGLTAPLVYVGKGAAADYAGKDVRGAVVMADGLAMPAVAHAAHRAGAAGMICVNPEGLHEMIISPVWGTPTPETAPDLPQLVAVSIRKDDGDALKALVARGSVTVRLQTEVETGWRPIPTLTAEIRGAEDRFVLLSGHVDSWHYGAMDNASANATMLEIGRIFSQHKSELRRGLRLAFWSGHSHARYGASAWYADNFFADLYDHCVCHVNAESTGGMGATNLAGAGCMAETWQFAAGPIRDVTGQELTYRRLPRNGDQSFEGVGIPSALAGLASQPEGGLGWWWHTPDDTLDKIDGPNFVRDTQVYLLACWRLCTLPVLPFDYTETANELRDRLHMLQESANGRFDLTPLITALDALHADAERLNAVAKGGGDPEAVNAAIMAVGRALIPVNYTLAGPFEIDLALENPILPGLAPVVTLAELDPASNDAGFLRTKLVRERNRVQHALATARRAIARAV